MSQVAKEPEAAEASAKESPETADKSKTPEVLTASTHTHTHLEILTFDQWRVLFLFV